MEIAYLCDTMLTELDIAKFIEKVGPDFNPPLSMRVNLSVYIQKLYKQAVIFVEMDEVESRILGMLAFYCTPKQYEEASLSLIAVDRTARSKGLGLTLIKRMIQHVSEAGMRVIETRTWSGNTHMIRLIEGIGFKFIKKNIDDDGRLSMHYRLEIDYALA